MHMCVVQFIFGEGILLVVVTVCGHVRQKLIYYNDVKFSDKQVWANSADRDQRSD